MTPTTESNLAYAPSANADDEPHTTSASLSEQLVPRIERRPHLREVRAAFGGSLVKVGVIWV